MSGDREDWRDPRCHMLSMRSYEEGSDGSEVPVPVSVTDAADTVREGLRSELQQQPDDRADTIRLLASEAGAIEFILGEFVERMKADVAAGRVDEGMNELVDVADHLKKLLFIAAWREAPMPGGER